MLNKILKSLGLGPRQEPERYTSQTAIERANWKYPGAEAAVRKLPLRPTVALACRWIAQARDKNNISPGKDKLEAAKSALGSVRYEYLRAVHYAGRRQPLIGESAMRNPDLVRRFDEELTRSAWSDFDTWDRGIMALTKLQEEARRWGRAVPRDLVVPLDVHTGIANMHAERLRLARMRRGGRDTGEAKPTPPAEPAAPPQIPESATMTVTNEDIARAAKEAEAVIAQAVADADQAGGQA